MLAKSVRCTSKTGEQSIVNLEKKGLVNCESSKLLIAFLKYPVVFIVTMRNVKFGGSIWFSCIHQIFARGATFGGWKYRT